MRVLCLLVLILVSGLGWSAEGYQRSYFGGWTDVDKDCRDTRAELLDTASYTFVQFDGCRVDQGLWVDPYTGIVAHYASELEVDHVVPLKEAWDSGAYLWTNTRRTLFANDPENLTAVTLSVNRSKGSRDPQAWMPPNLAYWDTYLTRWTAMKEKYGLSSDSGEQAAILRYRNMNTRLNSAPLVK